MPTDPELDRVRDWLERQTDALGGASVVLARLVRQAIGEVVDGPRTGRWSDGELEKTEKTYLGTKVEIVVRSALGLERTGRLDTVIDGIEVDIKWSETCGWMIPEEAVDQICFVIGTDRKAGSAVRSLNAGVARCSESALNKGRNKAQKRTLRSEAVHWIVDGALLTPSFFERMDRCDRDWVFAGDSGQERVVRLLDRVRNRKIPRSAIEIVAQQKDPMKRVRGARERLPNLAILGSRYHQTAIKKAIGDTDLVDGEDFFVSISI